jgi:CheY-like chemotaxis protein
MLAMEIIADAGYNALEAANADEALLILESRGDVTVVFADIDMPGKLNGIQLANRIREHWPSTEIILTSGHVRPNHEHLPAGAVFIPKPYQFSKLAKILQDFAR